LGLRPPCTVWRCDPRVRRALLQARLAVATVGIGRFTEAGASGIASKGAESLRPGLRA